MNILFSSPLRRAKTRTLLPVAATSLALAVLGGCAADPAQSAAQSEVTQSAASADDVSGNAQSAGSAIEVSLDSSTLIGQEMELNHDFWTADQAIEQAHNNVEISLSTLTGDESGGVSVSGQTVTITKGGYYTLNGTLQGQVVVEATDQDQVTLVLEGVDIQSPQGPAIWIKSAEGVHVILETGSQNSLADGGTLDEEADAALFSETDLQIDGEGQLNVTGTLADAVASKDDLVIQGGQFALNALDDGLRGKDALVITSGQIDITAGGDGMKSTNEDEEDRGYTLITGGQMTIRAASDGIDAVTDALIDGGTIAILESEEGIEAKNLLIGNGTVEITSTDDGLNATAGSSSTADNAAGENAIPEGAMPQGEALPEGMTPPEGGGWEAGGAPPEGMEDTADGMGAPGGMGGFGGEVPDGSRLVIYGGKVTIDAEGDGIDSNGTLEISGGDVTVFGTTRGGNGAFDSAGTFAISGGTVIALSVGQMEQGPSEATQGFAESRSSGTQGSLVRVEGADGSALVEVTAPKSFGYVFFSSPDVTGGETVLVD